MHADLIELAFAAGAALALRKRAARLRQKAAEGTSPAGEDFPAVMIRSPEAACSVNLAACFDTIADSIEAGLP